MLTPTPLLAFLLGCGIGIALSLVAGAYWCWQAGRACEQQAQKLEGRE